MTTDHHDAPGVTAHEPSSAACPPWAMQLIVDVKVAMTSTNARLDRLDEQITELKVDMKDVKSRLSSVEKQIYAAAAVLTIALGVGGYMSNKALDLWTEAVKHNVYASPAQSAPMPAPVRAPGSPE